MEDVIPSAGSAEGDTVGEPVIDGRVEESVPPPPEVPSVGPESPEDKSLNWRRRMRSHGHCLDHYPAIPGCPGCDAKARERKRYCGSFKKDDPRYSKYVTGDQVTLADLKGTVGIGNLNVRSYGARLIPISSISSRLTI